MSRTAARPKIVLGLPIPVEDASWRVWSGRAHLLSSRYATRFQNAGATVLMIPIAADGVSDLGSDARQIIGMLDGLIIAGGADVEPSRYDAPVDPNSGPFDEGRDAWELALLEAAIEAGVPVFAICRGMQLLNVLLGGTLIQHLPDTLGTTVHRPTRDAYGTHRVRTTESSWLRDAIGAEADVATYHHQAVHEIGKGLVIAATTEDGTVEALEDLSRNLIAVQWHPEASDNDRIFAKFVQLCDQQSARPKE